MALRGKGPLDGDGEPNCVAVAAFLAVRLVITMHFLTSASQRNDEKTGYTAKGTMA